MCLELNNVKSSKLSLGALHGLYQSYSTALKAATLINIIGNHNLEIFAPQITLSRFEGSEPDA